MEFHGCSNYTEPMPKMYVSKLIAILEDLSNQRFQALKDHNVQQADLLKGTIDALEGMLDDGFSTFLRV